MSELFEQKTDSIGRVRCRLVADDLRGIPFGDATEKQAPPVKARPASALLVGLSTMGKTAGAVGVDYQIMRNARNPVVQAQAAISMLHGIDSLLKTLRS